MTTAALLVLFAPVVGFVVQYFFGRRLPRQGDWWTIGAIGTSLRTASHRAATASGVPMRPRATADSAAWYSHSCFRSHGTSSGIASASRSLPAVSIIIAAS